MKVTFIICILLLLITLDAAPRTIRDSNEDENDLALATFCTSDRDCGSQGHCRLDMILHIFKCYYY